jgi:hypothetical protein
MTRRKKLITLILSAIADANINFTELRNLLGYLGFDERIRGSHYIFSKNGIDEILNLQPKDNKAKPYQVKQVRNVMLKYKLWSIKDD